MNALARVAAFLLAISACISLVAIEKHLALASNALAVMALSQPAPRRSTPGVQSMSLSTSHGHARMVDTVIDGGDAEPKGEPRFEAGGLKLPDGTLLQIVEDKQARTYVYIVRDDHGISVTAWAKTAPPEPQTCESRDTGQRVARMEER
jgi:hypothetical protein